MIKWNSPFAQVTYAANDAYIYALQAFDEPYLLSLVGIEQRKGRKKKKVKKEK